MIHTGWRSAITDVEHWRKQAEWESSNTKRHLKAGISKAKAIESLDTVYIIVTNISGGNFVIIRMDCFVFTYNL